MGFCAAAGPPTHWLSILVAVTWISVAYLPGVVRSVCLLSPLRCRLHLARVEFCEHMENEGELLLLAQLNDLPCIALGRCGRRYFVTYSTMSVSLLFIFNTATSLAPSSLGRISDGALCAMESRMWLSWESILSLVRSRFLSRKLRACFHSRPRFFRP